MARPRKDGLDYFPLDVDIDSDDKFQLLEAEHGVKGFGIVVKLLARIYKNGYYTKWTEAEQLLFSKRVSVDRNEVIACINSAIKWDIFDKTTFERYGILTSRGIQKRFLFVFKRREGKDKLPYWLLSDVSTKETPVSATETPVSVYKKYTKNRIEKNRIEKNIHPSDGLFDKFWQAYPRKEGRKDAEEYFLSNISEDDVGQLIRASENYSRQVEGRELRYVKVPVNFLQVWKDFIPKVEQSDESSTTSPYAVRYEKELYLRIKGLDESELQDFFDNLRTPGTVECEMLSYLGNEAKEKFLKQIYKQSNFNVREKTIQENTMQVIRA